MVDFQLVGAYCSKRLFMCLIILHMCANYSTCRTNRVPGFKSLVEPLCHTYLLNRYQFVQTSSVIKYVKFDATETATDKNSALTLLIQFETDLVIIQSCHSGELYFFYGYVYITMFGLRLLPQCKLDQTTYVRETTTSFFHGDCQKSPKWVFFLISKGSCIDSHNGTKF